jgi:hypothetical protein
VVGRKVRVFLTLSEGVGLAIPGLTPRMFFSRFALFMMSILIGEYWTSLGIGEGEAILFPLIPDPMLSLDGWEELN